MSFREALEALKDGKKVARVGWKGYWKKEKDIYSREGKDTIFMFCKDGKVIDVRDTQDVFFTIGNMVADDWHVVE